MNMRLVAILVAVPWVSAVGAALYALQPAPLPAIHAPVVEDPVWRVDKDVVLYAVDTNPLVTRTEQADGPTLVSLQGCNGMHDPKPGCGGDPAPWVCNRTGKGKKGTLACSCQQRCRPDEDGNLEQYDESEDCPRRCNKHCECHVEEQCKQGAIGSQP